MKKANVILDLIVLGLAIFFFYDSLSLPKGKGTPGSNPAIYPQIILISIIAFVILDLIKIIAEKNKEVFLQQLEKKNLKKLGLMTLSIAVLILLLTKVPFVVLSIGIVLIQCLLLKIKPVTAIITAVVLGVSVYSLFVFGLNIIL